MTAAHDAAPTSTFIQSVTFRPTAEGGGFTAAECDEIVSWGARTGAWTSGTVSDDGVLMPEIRTVDKADLERNDGNGWLFSRLVDLVACANDAWWRFDISGLGEQLQLLRYERSGHYTIHTDFGAAAAVRRKLTVIVQLSDGEDYSGGRLWIGIGNDVEDAPQERGSVVVFPSFVPHQITPVTKGVRHALVAWVHGPPFR